MDRIADYQRIIRHVLGEIASYTNNLSSESLDHVCAFDDEHGQYLLLSIGWQGGRRVHGTPVYVRLKNNQVWIEDNWTDISIVDRLTAEGIASADIVLGFEQPAPKDHSVSAVA